MDAKLKAKWVEALRSGKYKQGPNVYYNEKTEAHCAIGVLLEVAKVEDENANPFLPVPVQTVIAEMNDGIDAPEPEYNKPSQTFKQIANWIEKHL